MKKILLTMINIATISLAFAQNNVGIGTATPAASAALDITSTTRGLLIPRMTSAQRTAVLSPAMGLLVFDTDTKTLWAYDGAAWKNHYTNDGGGSLSLPFSQTVNTITGALQVTNQGLGAGLEGVTTNEFGIGINARANSAYGWALNAYANGPGGTSVRSTTDSGIAFHGENSYTGNINTLMNLLNRGLGKTASFQLSNNTSTAPNMQVAGNHLGDQVMVFQTNTNNNKPAVAINHSGTGEALKASAATGTGVLAISATGTALEVNGKLKIAGGNTNPANGAVLTSDATGFATWKKGRIGFAAHTAPPQAATVPNGLTLTKIEFAVEDFDLDNGFNSFTGTVNSNSSGFFAPVSGYYFFGAECKLSVSGSQFHQGEISLVVENPNTGTNLLANSIGSIVNYSTWAEMLLSTSGMYHLSQGERVRVVVSQFNTSQLTANISTGTKDARFFGYLVFAD